jgi:SAM-dependent methyltransferase
MQRIPEPDLMNDEAQAQAYAAADFAEPHERFVELFRELFPHWHGTGWVLDLGCGPADVTLRFARAYPGCMIHGVDGAAAMLRLGRKAVAAAGCAGRVDLIEGYLPGAALPRARYDAVISNSLLHHLNDPGVLWRAVAAHAQPGAPIWVMDLRRPANEGEVQALVARYAQGEAEVLRRDFYHSLLAAYRSDEVEQQLHAASLDYLQVRVIGDRHLTVSGVMA